MSDKPRIEGDRNRHQYRCSCGKTEYVLTLAVGDRKTTRFCKHCRKTIKPIETSRIRVQGYAVREKELKPLW